MIKLRTVWSFKGTGPVTALKFSHDGHLSAAFGACALIFDRDGKIISQYCGTWMLSASFCCGKFTFLDDSGVYHIYSLEDNAWKHQGAILEINEDDDPPTVVSETCRNLMAVGKDGYIYLLDISDPENAVVLWKYKTSAEGWLPYIVLFGQECRYIVASGLDSKFHIFAAKTGKKVLTKTLHGLISSIDVWNNRIAVGMNNGTLYVFELGVLIPQLSSPKIDQLMDSFSKQPASQISVD